MNNLIRNGYGDYDAVTEDMVTGSLCVLDENDDEDMFEKVLPTFRPSNRIGIGTGLKIRVLWVRLPPWPLCRYMSMVKTKRLLIFGSEFESR